jgi:hypothetical protein
VTAVSPSSISTRAASGGLLALAAIHLAWAAGSSWPLATRADLADAVIGRSGGEVPSPAACLLVAGLLASAAATLGAPDSRPRRAGARTLVMAFGARGTLGAAGRTELLVPGSSSRRFRALDRRLYSPICLTLAALALPAARVGRSPWR